MDRIELIRLLDQEIERLRQARTLLAGATDQNSSHKGRRKMSAKARRRISEAQKKRWAARKKAAK